MADGILLLTPHLICNLIYSASSQDPLVQQWRSYCSPSGRGRAEYSMHQAISTGVEREQAREVS